MGKSGRGHSPFSYQAVCVGTVSGRPIRSWPARRQALKVGVLVARPLQAVNPAEADRLHDAIGPRDRSPSRTGLVDAYPEFSTGRVVLGKPAGEIFGALKHEAIGLSDCHQVKLTNDDPLRSSVAPLFQCCS